jgi:hypothetical protein
VVVPNLVDNSEEDGSREWEPEPFRPFAIEAFSASEDKINPEIVECRGIVPELDVRRAEGTEIAFGRCGFGFTHNVSKPVRDRFDRCGKGGIAVEPAERFVG